MCVRYAVDHTRLATRAAIPDDITVGFRRHGGRDVESGSSENRSDWGWTNWFGSRPLCQGERLLRCDLRPWSNCREHSALGSCTALHSLRLEYHFARPQDDPPGKT